MKTIKQLRISRGMPQKQFANMLGTYPCRVCNWERRNQTPSLRYAFKIAQLFGIPIEELDYLRQQNMATGAKAVHAPTASF